MTFPDNGCTHGEGCPAHPAATGLHNYDADPVALMGAINDTLADARRSYRSAISSMGAHGAPATAVVAFVLEWRLRQVPPAPPGAVGNVFAPTFPELADMIVAALRETGHVRD